MNAAAIHEIVEKQRAYFRTGQTLDPDFRLKQLQKLKEAVIRHCNELEHALKADLGRAPLEAYFCDIGSLLLELNETARGLRRWAKPEDSMETAGTATETEGETAEPAGTAEESAEPESTENPNAGDGKPAETEKPE